MKRSDRKPNYAISRDRGDLEKARVMLEAIKAGGIDPLEAAVIRQRRGGHQVSSRPARKLVDCQEVPYASTKPEVEE